MTEITVVPKTETDIKNVLKPLLTDLLSSFHFRKFPSMMRDLFFNNFFLPVVRYNLFVTLQPINKLLIFNIGKSQNIAFFEK